MNLPDDTIAAVSTPPGDGGIGIVRLSGPDSFGITKKIFLASGTAEPEYNRARSMRHGYIIDPATSEKIDETLVTFMKAPRTYTREDVVEINCHGGMVVLKRIIGLVLKEGARLAEPGEFTRRAFLNGRIDLSQAEAVIDVIRARTDRAGKLAQQQLKGRLSYEITEQRDKVADLCALVEAHIDFPEEEVELPRKDEMLGSMRPVIRNLAALVKSYDEGRRYREGAAMAIVGKPNVGKSSLMNALLKKDRAIVTELPGTTRDVIEEGLNMGGMPVRIMDTAGIREAHDLAEIEGVKRSLAAIEGADIVLAVFDGSGPADDADAEVLERTKEKKTICVINKTDISDPRFSITTLHQAVRISALNGEGIAGLTEKIIEALIGNKNDGGESADILITNARHKQLLDRALESLKKAETTFAGEEPLEITALFLRECLDSLGEIVGLVTTEDILDRIFSEFCIGK
jgi:tRNA modification GTPase